MWGERRLSRQGTDNRSRQGEEGQKKMIEDDRVMIRGSSGFEKMKGQRGKKSGSHGRMRSGWNAGRCVFTRTQAILAFKTAIMKELSDTEGCFLPFLSLYSLFLCHPTLLIITINPSRCLFVPLFSQPISFRLSFSLSPPPERLFVCISNKGVVLFDRSGLLAGMLCA